MISAALAWEGRRWGEGKANLKRAGRTVTDLGLLTAMTGFFQYSNDEMSFVALEVCVCVGVCACVCV